MFEFAQEWNSALFNQPFRIGKGNPGHPGAKPARVDAKDEMS